MTSNWKLWTFTPNGLIFGRFMATSQAFFFFFLPREAFKPSTLEALIILTTRNIIFLSKAVCVIVSCYKVKSNVYGQKPIWFHLPRYEDVWSHKHAMETKNRNKIEPFRNDEKNIQISSDISENCNNENLLLICSKIPVVSHHFSWCHDTWSQDLKSLLLLLLHCTV